MLRRVFGSADRVLLAWCALALLLWLSQFAPTALRVLRRLTGSA